MKQKLLLATNVAYYPSVGGTERVMQFVLESMVQKFEKVVLFTPTCKKEIDINGVVVKPYSMFNLLMYAIQNRPSVYFPMVAHSQITINNIQLLSKLSDKTIVHIIGGYGKGLPKGLRQKVLLKIKKYSDYAIHVDPFSTEFLIDKAIEPDINYVFISQAIDVKELSKVKITNKNQYYLYAHNLWHWKRPELFLEIVKQCPSLSFQIVATNNTGDVIQSIVERAKKLPNLKINMGVSREQYLHILGNAQGVISTSEIEGAQPNLLLESAWLKVPYLSLFPGQNLSHYPNVELFHESGDIISRITAAKYTLKVEKSSQLELSRKMLSKKTFSPKYILHQYDTLLGVE